MSLKLACKKLARSNKDYLKLFDLHGHLVFSPKAMRTPFESLVRALAHQQLHANAAEAILGRLLARFTKNDFPTPHQLLELSELEYREFGFSTAKAKSLIDIATKTIEGIVPTSEEIVTMSDEEIIERLTQIRGVGRWTVEMLLIFQLGRMDVWPVDDFGVQTGYMVFKKKRERPPKKKLLEYGEQWRPYRTAAALYLWEVANHHKKKAIEKRKKQRAI